jgi:prolipoprotein diacylglyceryltransferase
MAAFALLYVLAVLRRNDFVIGNGFYLALAFYGMQRFVWEFFKPYAPLIGPLTLFHLLSLVVLLYAAVMLMTAPIARSSHDPAVA